MTPMSKSSNTNHTPQRSGDQALGEFSDGEHTVGTSWDYSACNHFRVQILVPGKSMTSYDALHPPLVQLIEGCLHKKLDHQGFRISTKLPDSHSSGAWIIRALRGGIRGLKVMLERGSDTRKPFLNVVPDSRLSSMIWMAVHVTVILCMIVALLIRITNLAGPGGPPFVIGFLMLLIVVGLPAYLLAWITDRLLKGIFGPGMSKADIDAFGNYLVAEIHQSVWGAIWRPEVPAAASIDQATVDLWLLPLLFPRSGVLAAILRIRDGDQPRWYSWKVIIES